MRELKFRGWADNGFVYLDVREDNDFGFYDFYSSCTNDDIEQYTGLEDKNGKEIYEGDIVAVKDNDIPFALVNAMANEKWLVRFGKHRAGFTLVKSTRRRNFIRTFQNTKQDDIEVVGNIHENPELLEEE